MTSAELAAAVKTAGTWVEVAGILDTSLSAVFKRATRVGLDTSHFRGRGWRRGSTTPVVRVRSLAEVLVKGPLCKTSDLRRRLIAEGLKEDRCEGCLLVEWNGEPIPLELDHINGDRTDNQLENLRLLCPKCHAMTTTYRGRNIVRRYA